MAELEAKKADAQETPPRKAGSAASLSALSLTGVFSGLLRTGAGCFKDERNQLNVRTLNFVLFFAASFITLYYVNSIFLSLARINNIDLEKFVKKQDGILSPAKDAPALNPLAFYMEGMKKRDIFRMGDKISQADADAISSQAAEAARTLKLVGISWSDSPDVMIEDTRISKTYFVKKGQLVGELIVEEIYKDKVVLRLGAETFELR